MKAPQNYLFQLAIQDAETPQEMYCRSMKMLCECLPGTTLLGYVDTFISDGDVRQSYIFDCGLAIAPVDAALMPKSQDLPRAFGKKVSAVGVDEHDGRSVLVVECDDGQTAIGFVGRFALLTWQLGAGG
jgi:hypothetical protein